MSGKEKTKVNIVGAGLAGLSAAIHLAYAGVPSRLISCQPSERAQSVLAAGGINGALNTMGEGDVPDNHFRDTMRAGCDIADPAAVRNLTDNAPDVLRWLDSIGVPFQRKGKVIQQRNFGGQKKKRTAFAKSSTGKALMTALIDEARRFEADGLITRFARHDFVRLIITENGNKCLGLVVRDNVTNEILSFSGPVIMAVGGLNGLFPGHTTGTTANNADPAAVLFSQGVVFSNLEMIQYHPTTLAIPAKRLLVSEAARGEGGRLFIFRNGEKWYFMEEKYPELGNLMPRDVVSREEYFVMNDPSCEGQVYLDCTGLSAEIWKNKLSDLRREVIYYTKIDPVKAPIPVEPGIHYFMGGIDTDAGHRTNIAGLYAAGECTSLYHGANRLGGNSTLGAIYGGKKAAETAAREIGEFGEDKEAYSSAGQTGLPEAAHGFIIKEEGASSSFESRADLSVSKYAERPNEAHDRALGENLYACLGVARDEAQLENGKKNLEKMFAETKSPREKRRILLGLAIVESALFRKESRGAQYRSDYTERDPAFQGSVLASLAGPPENENISISFRQA